MADEILGNIHDAGITPGAPSAPADTGRGEILGNIHHLDPSKIESVSDHYSSFGQQALTAAEGLGQGFAGPLATGAERTLSAIGVPGLTAEEQQARKSENPILSGVSEAVGFGAGALTGTGEAALLGKIGEGAAGLAGLGKAAGLGAGIAEHAIKGGAELAALQAGEETSKFLNSDPNQTLGTAAVNVGLSGLIGVGAGALLGAVKPAIAASAEKLDKFATDYRDEIDLLQNGSNSKDVAGLNTPGRKLARSLFKRGAERLARSAGEATSGGLGAVAGALIGHPIAGAYVSEKILAPILSQLALPFAESAVNGAAMRSAIEYFGSALKGETVLNTAVKGIFAGGELIPKHLLPDEEKRDELKRTLASLDDPENMLQVGGNIGHYLPAHGTAASELAATTKNYFDSITPRPSQLNPFDAQLPVPKTELRKYNRALDVANQPLVILQHTRDGTLQAQDIATLQTLYPGFHSAVVSKLTDQIIDHNSKGNPIPLRMRQSLSLLTGSPVGAAQMQPVMQSIIAANGMQQSTNQQVAQARASNKASGVELKQINKVNSLYSTGLQSREINRRSK